MPRAKRNLITSNGRPKIPINWEMVDKYLRAECSGVEIADMIGMHYETLYDRVVLEKGVGFSEYALSKKEGGNGLIRARQFSSAMSGNTRMLELLGEERLGQGQKKTDSYPGEAAIDAILSDVKSADVIEKQAAEIKELKAKIESFSKTETIDFAGDKTV